MITAILAGTLLLSPVAQGGEDDFGHSKMGSAFDSGMRTRPKKLEGIGNAPFPITSKNPEVQEWFNQGNALLHSFWWEDAERAFRWCLKLDPDCAMAYLGLAQCGYNWFSGSGSSDPKNRYRLFLAEAVKRKGSVSERERMYIEAWESAFAPGSRRAAGTLRTELRKIVAKYPSDVEAKALLAFFSVGGGVERKEAQALIDQVLAKSPEHPAAHHAAIHLWDFVEPENALASCKAYGGIAPRIGHALHMPGHAYSKMGMWHEAARSMDAATRTELFYMNDRLALPHESWNYSHNRNYLCYIQGQLGMAEASIHGAWDLLNAPTDPDGNNENNAGFSEGMTALIRAYVKFEKWDEILKPGNIPWGNSSRNKSLKAYAETLALAGTGRIKEARESFEAMKNLSGRGGRRSTAVAAEAQLLLAEGKPREAVKKLLERAPNESFGGDPPSSSWPLYRLVGDAYMVEKSYKLAVDSYTRALTKEANDGFSLAGLTRAYAALGDSANAKKYAAQFKYVCRMPTRA